MAKEKPNMNVVFVGHVDAGKSTIVGRMLYDSGAVPEQEMKKYKEEAEKHGKAGFEFAYVMDRIKEERERGVTIDLAYRKIITQKYSQKIAKKVQILYGGSVKHDNVVSFVKDAGFQGVLVGGASLDPAEFAKIVKEL